MSMKNKWYVLVLAVLVVVSSIRLGWETHSDPLFECRARVHVKQLGIENDLCLNGTLDVFLSLHESGKGYLLMSGSLSCPLLQHEIINDVVNFTYSKEGNYYSLSLSKPTVGINSLFGELKSGNAKIRLTQVNSGDYIVSSPIKTVMMCTRD
ncbi:Uncharacterised protein [Serratia fonticola]|nr:Uncharacterised protein [Serratia fonticola]